MIFNKDLLLERKGMTDTELYDIILNGKWTIDKFNELATGVFQDDGDNITTADIDDIHGISARGQHEFNYMLWSSGLSFTSRDENGYPLIPEAPSERMVELVDKLLPTFKGQDAFTSYNGNEYFEKKFSGGTAIFLPARLFVLGFQEMYNMEDDYGIIPMPKFDETIDGYHSTVGNLVIWGLVPNTVVDTEMSSAVAESLAYEGYHNVVPTYFEENLKLKYTRGDINTESEILDLIRYGARTDFLYINTLGGLGNMFTTCYDMGSNVLTSFYAARYTMAQTTLEQYIANLEE